jgi:hypothetical protein
MFYEQTADELADRLGGFVQLLVGDQRRAVESGVGAVEGRGDAGRDRF